MHPDNPRHPEPNRRKQDHWQTDIEGRIGNLSEGMGQLIDRMDSSDKVMHEIKHDVANNTLVTDGVAKSVREMKITVEDAAADGRSAVGMMKNLQALDRIGHLCGIAMKKIVPIVALVSTAIVAIKAIWK